MKLLHTLTAAATSLLLASQSSQAALTLYEGFEYTSGDDLDGNGSGIGFGSNLWTGLNSSGTNPHSVGSGLSFGSLEVTGGSAERDIRNGRSTATRLIAASSVTDLTADNTTIWFSVLMDPTINTATTGGQPANTYGTLIFGNAGLTDSSSGTQNGAGTTIANSGDAVGVGFFGNTTFAGVGIQGVTFSDGTIDQGNGASNAITTGDSLSLIVGRIDWAADGSNDTITLYDVTDPAAGLPGTAFSTMTLDVDQTTFDTISISGGQTEAFDEIRFGTELADVIPVPEPSSSLLLGLGSAALLLRRKRA
ncbi:PEP-CTERM sorting domain-containing protein [Verrucomicrobiaceae bacterium R5-34]|uniref:PEP-CTERM sorting domain-containing protein n=1 Tax=Oceaniferula flava TaxID=2800421 RepID=A0AAE2SDX4_9BACT|nr:PEP-CTERM sorting domain-containing protein [Oceaniferula flavus]MBK1829780.1 PEP-CTERM sorting domain-containing protein [Verrucomicrobiaceae bacterium R5-34]MBK1856415.1 PEP-CTERM sorting domain-containing protein [Oceaniferula flavus]MBM1137722.1 PEP-CTERM sorting domain-containing protein [Oceaniferula flavus]